jgi:predicted dienelactone hydrolase
MGRMKVFFDRYLFNAMVGSSLWLLGLVTLLMRSPPVMAAEKISFWYGALEVSIPVDSLETFAKTGEIDDSLAVYDQYLGEQKLAKLRRNLTYSIDFDPVIISRWLNTSVGENVLKYLGQIIKPSIEQNGFYALRSALISAADSPEKLTLLNILHQFPAETIRVDAKSILKLASTFDELKKDTNQAIASVTKQAVTSEISEPAINFAQQPDLTKSGTFAFQKQTLSLVNQQSDWTTSRLRDRAAYPKKDRKLDVDFYRPIVQQNASIPVIVISPGFGADKTNFSYLGEHLASYGFAVAILNHPGSDRQNLQNFLAGKTRELVKAEELIKRPQDITYLLDELQKQEARNPLLSGTLDTLNLEQVGVIGHSLGAYAGLTLAGAEPNVKDLQQNCPGDRTPINFNWFNPSQQLQCIASQLSPNENYQLLDERIKAVFAINPIGSSIFGQAELNKLQIPVVFVAGTSDIIAPPLLEQIEPFSWLGSRDKYLLLINQGIHTYGSPDTLSRLVSSNTEKSNTEKNFNPQLAHEYFQSMSLAFMKTHLVNSPQYRSFLSNDYAEYISHKSMQLDLINSSANTDLITLED